MSATKTFPVWPLLSVLFLLAAGCDNVGRAFDPDFNPNAPGPNTTTSTVAIVRSGGDLRDGRPKVKATAPKGGGWPLTVPIVVEFSESLNEESVLPTSTGGTDGKVIVRVKGTTTVLPCNYDFVAAGRVLVLRPVTPLSNEQNPSYEVVLLPDGRDADGVRFQVATEGEVLAEFQVNQDASFEDGRILTTFPRDNQSDGLRETNYYVFFDRPVTPASVTAVNFVVRAAGGAAVLGDRDLPLALLGNDDPRIVRFAPDDPFAASTRFELVVDGTITFGTAGTLDFRGRTPFATFTTVGPRAPTAVHVGNPSPGFDDKINATNLGVVSLAVTPPSDAESGDRVVARIYGGDRETTATGDLVFVERSATLTTAGATPVSVDFSGALGTVANAKLDDGEITFCVQLQRGSQHSGFARNATSAAPIFDVTAPTLTQAGPPGSTTGNDIFTDLEHLAFHGIASERISAASLVVGSNGPVEMFAASTDGRFVMKPVTLGLLAAPLSYSLLLTDLAGNLGVAAVTGNVVQRGIVSGTVSGTLTVEAYDHATLQPIGGATVLVDPGVPVVPAVGQVVGTTDGNGRVVFTGLPSNSHTITIVRAGYHLLTFYDLSAANVSMPLRPITGATATMTGTALLQAPAGTTVLVGNNTYDDPLVLAVATAASAPTTILDTAIQPNRMQVVTAFGGTFEPTATPTFAFHGYQMLGPTFLTPTPPGAPAAPGARSTQSLALVTSTGTTTNVAPYAKDLALSTGLDTANLVGGKPIVRVTASLRGFHGQALAGVGFATSTGGAQYSISATSGLPISTGLAAFAPSTWFVTEARDTGGRVCRQRALVLLLFGFVDTIPPPGIPAVTVPGGPFAGSPTVTFADHLDPGLAPNGVAVAEITAQDPAGRQWLVFLTDGDVVGGTSTVQYPDLVTANVAGLSAGSWTVRAESRLLSEFGLLPSAGTSTRTELVLSERLRQEVTYARSAAVPFTVQ